MSISEPAGKAAGETAGNGAAVGGKTPPYVGQIVKYHLFPDKFVPGIIEYVQPNGVVELVYFYKGESNFAVASLGDKTYEYSY